MKASELMIGNWVIVYEKAMPVKARVESVFGRGAMVLGHVRSADLGFMAPIPLTPEILEKNGIELSVGPGGLYQGAISGVNCHIEFNIIKYVHELQNALRLCGIEKEIEL